MHLFISGFNTGLSLLNYTGDQVQAITEVSLLTKIILHCIFTV